MGFWVLLSSLLVNLALALVILTRATRVSSSTYFGISVLFIALGSFGSLLMLYGWNENTVRIGVLLFLVAPIVATLYTTLFAKYFSDIDIPKKYTAIGIFSGITAVFAAVVLSSVPGTTVAVASNSWAGNSVDLQHGWYLVYGVYFALMSIISYVYLLAGIRRSRGRIHRQRQLVLLGLITSTLLVFLTSIVMPLYGDASWLWAASAWTIFYSVATCYALVKHGLLDVRSSLVLTLTYFLSLAALAILYYIIALTVSALFFGGSITAGFNGFEVAIALILAFLFQPIRRFFDTFTSNFFYQDAYSVDDFFARLSRTLSTTNDLQLLMKRAAETISQTLKSADVSFVVYTGVDRAEQIGVGRFSRVSFKDIQWLDAHLETTDLAPKVLTLLDEDEEPLRRMMVSHRIAIILPLVRQGVKMGYLLLGEHKRSSYSARDIRVIRTLADELVIAIQNALSVEEIKELNGHLEQRIDAATKELRASNAQLQRLDEAKDEFISMASHQLRTPLTSIKGYISMLMEGDVGKVTSEQKHLLNEAFVSSERMVRLIGDFLNVSRLQTGKFVIDKHPVDLALLVQHEIDGLSANASARGMKFVYKKPKNIPMLELDENKIQQVVMNFSDNAIYYSKDKGTITISLKKVPGFVEFKVVDKGIGVPKEEQEQLFNKFFRATNARRARPDGTGVGLFLAKKVIDDHGGRVIFESKEGEGSTFGFMLPLPKPEKKR
ncbi:MAG: ATP-binding protein [Candidatus Saccharimonadota bacterium]